MILVKPFARMLSNYNPAPDVPFSLEEGQTLLKRIDWFARISHRSEDAPSDTDRFLRFVVISKGDWSVTEHEKVSVLFEVDRGVTHELVRHRIAAYTQESTRFVNYEKKMPPRFICPFPLMWHDDVTETTGVRVAMDWERLVNETPELVEQYDAHLVSPSDMLAYSLWARAIEEDCQVYKLLIKDGKPPQIARSVFPNALASRIAATLDCRAWRHVMCMRTSAEAHPQFKEVSIPLLEEFKSKIPVLYEDIVPNARQIDNMKLPQ